MLEKASPLIFATSAKVPDERALDNRHMQAPDFDAVELSASSADLANMAVAEVPAVIWRTVDVKCLGSWLYLQVLLVTSTKL